jgi:hypothetical protein
MSQRSNDSLGPMVDSDRMNSVATESERRIQEAPDCPVQLEDKSSNGRPALTVGLTWHAPDSAQWLSGAPIASSLLSGYGSGWGL